MATDVIMPALGLAQETGKILRWFKSEGDTVAKGEPLAYWSSRGKLSLAVNEGDARREFGAWRGERVVVARER